MATAGKAKEIPTYSPRSLEGTRKAFPLSLALTLFFLSRLTKFPSPVPPVSALAGNQNNRTGSLCEVPVFWVNRPRRVDGDCCCLSITRPSANNKSNRKNKWIVEWTIRHGRMTRVRRSVWWIICALHWAVTRQISYTRRGRSSMHPSLTWPIQWPVLWTRHRLSLTGRGRPKVSSSAATMVVRRHSISTTFYRTSASSAPIRSSSSFSRRRSVSSWRSLISVRCSSRSFPSTGATSPSCATRPVWRFTKCESVPLSTKLFFSLRWWISNGNCLMVLSSVSNSASSLYHELLACRDDLRYFHCADVSVFSRKKSESTAACCDVGPPFFPPVGSLWHAGMKKKSNRYIFLSSHM